MNILILSRKPRLASTRNLCEAARQRGHRVEVLDFLRCSLDISCNRSAVIYDGRRVTGIDAIIPRIGSSHASYGAAVVQQFQLMGVRSANSADSIRCAHDKLRCLQLLAAAGIGLPATGYAHESSDLVDLIEVVGGAPLVVKLLAQQPGGSIILADSAAAAESVVEAFQDLDARSLIQEFIAASAGVSVRCLVIGDRIAAAVERRAPAGEFRSNLHRGAKATAVDLTEAETQTAVRAVQTLGLEVAGVDLLRSPRGPLVIAINSTPELESIERATGVNVAGAIIDHLEDCHGAAERQPCAAFDSGRVVAAPLELLDAAEHLTGALL